MKTIGKIIMTVLAISVLFVPVFAVQQIEARAIDHALLVEGMYTNGTAVNFADVDNDTIEMIDDAYPFSDANFTETYDSALFIGSPGAYDMLYRERATYIGNGTYTMSYNISEEPVNPSLRRLYIPLDLNATDFASADFYRIASNWETAPQIYYIEEGGNMGELGYCLEVAEDEYLFINTIQTRSDLAELEDATLFLYYNIVEEPTAESWTVRIQTEVYTGADILTWNDETLYIISVLICNVILIGGILLASDPIDISIEKPKKWR